MAIAKIIGITPPGLSLKGINEFIPDLYLFPKEGLQNTAGEVKGPDFKIRTDHEVADADVRRADDKIVLFYLNNLAVYDNLRTSFEDEEQAVHCKTDGRRRRDQSDTVFQYDIFVRIVNSAAGIVDDGFNGDFVFKHNYSFRVAKIAFFTTYGYSKCHY